MGNGESAMLGAGSDYVAHVEIPALQPFAPGLQWDSEKHESERPLQVGRQWPCRFGKDFVGTAAVEFQDDVLAHRSDPMRRAEWCASQRSPGADLEIAAEQHRRQRIRAHN